MCRKMKKKLRTLLSLLLVFSLVFVQGSITVNAGAIYGDADNYYDNAFDNGYDSYENIVWTYDYLNNELIVGGKGDMPEFTYAPWSEYSDTALTITIVGELTSVSANAFAGFAKAEIVRFMANVEKIYSGWIQAVASTRTFKPNVGK